MQLKINADACASGALPDWHKACVSQADVLTLKGNRHALFFSNFNAAAANIGGGAQPLAATAVRPDLHDGDLQPAIRVDAVYQADAGAVRRHAVAAADHVLDPDRAANLSVAVPRLSGGSLRPAPLAVGRRAADRRELGADRARDVAGRRE